MIEICANCGNHEWDKEIIGNKLCCPKCGAQWEFISLPLFILTGCSGVGKTTTAIEIMRKRVDYVVLDADILSGYVDWNSEESCNDWVELIANISKDIMQAGRGISDENWLKSSADYNRYFMEHDSLGDARFETLDITGKEPGEVAEYVMEWVKKYL